MDKVITSPANRLPQVYTRLVGRLRSICRRPACWVLLCVVSLILFMWPFIPAPGEWSAHHQYLYLYVAWAFTVALIALVALNLSPFRQWPGDSDKD